MVQDDTTGEIDQLRTNADNLAKCLHALLERIELLEAKKSSSQNGDVVLSSPKSQRLENPNFKDEQASNNLQLVLHLYFHKEIIG